jgi:hypothetical protein
VASEPHFATAVSDTSEQSMLQLSSVAQQGKPPGFGIQLPSTPTPVQQPLTPLSVVQFAPAAVQVSGATVVNGSSVVGGFVKVTPLSGSPSVVVAVTPPSLAVVVAVSPPSLALVVGSEPLLAVVVDASVTVPPVLSRVVVRSSPSGIVTTVPSVPSAAVVLSEATLVLPPLRNVVVGPTLPTVVVLTSSVVCVDTPVVPLRPVVVISALPTVVESVPEKGVVDPVPVVSVPGSPGVVDSGSGVVCVPVVTSVP